MTDLSMLSIAEAGRGMRAGQFTPVDLLDACLSRMETEQPRCNAYVYLDKKAARSEAEKATLEMREKDRGPLHGICIALKDIFYTRGIPTTAGSELMLDFCPPYNGTIVQRLLDAGAVMIGKTNTHEWAFGPTTEESCFGPSKNPWNEERITGGSSGGSAAAVATGMAFMAMGSDTGGSVRIPAALCGTVGFKPTYGMASLYGVVGLSFNLDHPGPLTRSVMDTALVMDAITGFDPKDPCPGRWTGGFPRFAEGLRGVKDLKGKVLAVPTNFFFDKTDYEVEAIVRDGIRSLGLLGAEIRPIEIPMLEKVPEVSTTILFAEAAYTHQERFAKMGDQYKPGVRARIEQGMKYSAVEYINAVKARDEIVRAWEYALEGIDAVIAPTCPITAYQIGMAPPWHIKTRGRVEEGRAMCTYHTRLSNLTGGPALSVPCGLTSEGLPVGMMLMGKRGDDVNVLQIGYAYEQHYPFPPYGRN